MKNRTGDLTRRDFIELSAAVAAGAMLPKFAAAQTAAAGYDYESLPPLRETAAKKGIYFGCATDAARLDISKGGKDYEADFSDAVARECNIVVAEGATKWDIIHPERDKWNFGPTDKLLEYAQSHGMKMRGHTLIWYEALPAWAKKALEDDKSKAEALMEEHIGAVMSRYKGKFLSWDVVNEALKPGEAWWLGDQMRDTPWREAMGDSYVEKAFRMAAQADPDAQLVYNDYQIEAGSVKAKAALKLLRGLKDKNVPIHAVGLQAHMHTGSKLDPLENFCKEAKSLGLEVIITELDVFDSARATQEENDKRVAAKTKEFLDIISSVAVPKQILTWGLSDRHSWLSNAKWNKSNPTGRRIRGLPLDDNMRRKPMWRALHEFLEKA